MFEVAVERQGSVRLIDPDELVTMLMY